MNERLKAIREDLGMSRATFGEKLGISGDVVNNLERGRVEIKKDRIKLVCSVFGVNEEWLRTGEGEMYDIPEDETAAIVSDLLEENNPFYDIIKGIMKTYQELDDKSQNVLLEFSKELLENLKKGGD
ncbi:MAG: helix-turn-helix transcriptional regulator [Lachnospiraceae bacterium]|nr:helix-turn-helix transcriptional regulator [Lachnospiraceae bacterium]